MKMITIARFFQETRFTKKTRKMVRFLSLLASSITMTFGLDDFQPPAEEPEDLEIEEEEDADLGEQTVLGKHEREDIDDGEDEPNKK